MIEIILYIIFGISVFLPIYTYAIYPFVLKLFRKKQYMIGDIKPSVSAVICFGNGDNFIKQNNVKNTNYQNLQIITEKDINKAISESTGDIVLFLDNETELDLNAINEIVKLFADERIDMVVGEQTCREGNSAFWKYETKIRSMESKVGSVSGANNSLFAVRKKSLFKIPSKIRNVPFFISTKIKQNKGNIVYCPDAKTYETKSEGTNFVHHISDASGYWQAFLVFWRMLLPRRGSFIYVSHRVMKWFVWLNILAICLSSLFISIFFFKWFYIVFAIECLALFISTVLALLKVKNKYLSLFPYFLMLNISYFLGIFVCPKKEN